MQKCSTFGYFLGHLRHLPGRAVDTDNNSLKLLQPNLNNLKNILEAYLN